MALMIMALRKILFIFTPKNSNSTHPPEMGINPLIPKTACPCGRVIKKRQSHMQFSHHMQRICQWTTAYAGCSPECSAGERYNNNTEYTIIYPIYGNYTLSVYTKKTHMKTNHTKISYSSYSLNNINTHPEASAMGLEYQKLDKRRCENWHFAKWQRVEDGVHAAVRQDCLLVGLV